MNKKIQPKMQLVTFKCASCGATYEIMSTLKQTQVAVDVCSNCHAFYKGNAADQKVKGRAEKLSSKFDAGKQTMTAKPAKTEKATKKTTKNKNVIKSLSDLTLE